MKFRNKGRKIYKTKEKNYYGKTPFGKFMSGALTVLLIGGIGFLGYSAAEPLINYSKKRGDDAPAVTEPSTGITAETTGATAAVVTIPENLNAETYKMVSLKPDALKDSSSLQTALSAINVNVGYEYVSVPLKVSGGEIYYASGISEAQLSGAVQSPLTLGDITAAVRNAGFKPVAEISMLEDHIAPYTYADMAYTTVDDGSRWIDAKGKHWLSPLSDRANTYVTAVCDEIAAADFDRAICSDIHYPQLSANDKELLGESVSGSDRYLALTSLTNNLYSRMLSGNTTMLLEVSAYDILTENCDVIQPMLLEVNTVVLDINFDELGETVAAGGTTYEFTGTAEEKASKLIGLVQYKLSDYNVAVRFSGDSVPENELIKAKDALSDYGYTSFIIG